MKTTTKYALVIVAMVALSEVISVGQNHFDGGYKNEVAEWDQWAADQRRENDRQLQIARDNIRRYQASGVSVTQN